MLSAILITKNEASRIKHCLASLSFCDEIVVVDNASDDDTIKIAEKFGCRIFICTDWPGFGKQKQRALEHARGKWILSIDADELVTPELQDEITQAISSETYQGYRLRRKSRFLGKWMKHGGWYPDYVTRLALRDACRFDSAPVHEKLSVEGAVGKLKNHLLHYSYRDISDVLVKQTRYALASAKQIRQRKGREISVILTLFRSLWTFFRLYLLQLGLLDGRQGLISAVAKSQETFWKYVAAEFDSFDEAKKN